MVRRVERFVVSVAPPPMASRACTGEPSLARAFEVACWLAALGLIGHLIWLLAAR